MYQVPADSAWCQGAVPTPAPVPTSNDPESPLLPTASWNPPAVPVPASESATMPELPPPLGKAAPLTQATTVRALPVTAGAVGAIGVVTAVVVPLKPRAPSVAAQLRGPGVSS